jgi:hypothetical protein
MRAEATVQPRPFPLATKAAANAQYRNVHVVAAPCRNRYSDSPMS